MKKRDTFGVNAGAQHVVATFNELKVSAHSILQEKFTELLTSISTLMENILLSKQGDLGF